MSYDLMLKNALCLHEEGQLDQAEKIYRQILEAVPDNPDILNLLGLIAQAKELHREACALFMNALRIKHDDIPIMYNLAFSLKADNQHAEAMKYFLKIRELRPEIKETYNEIALLYWQKNDIAEARKNWQYAISSDKNFVEAKVNLAMSFKKENMAKAIEDMKKLTIEFANSSMVFYGLACLYFENKDFNKSWNCAIKAKELAPTDDNVRVLLGKLACIDKQFENAKIYFAKAELINPFNIEAIRGLADIYSKESNFEEAEVRYKKLLQADAKNFEVHNNYAEMLQRQGRKAEALEEYRAAVIINHKSAEVCNNLALILRDVGEFDEALGLLFNALNYSPNADEISINISETLMILAETDKEKAFKIAENWFNSHKTNIFAQHLYATFKGEDFEDNKIYAKKLFDHFADNYELVMQNLGYSVPLAMGRIAGSLEGRILDLGCGTGLVGQALKNDRNKIIGVDISQKMIDRAATKKVYDKLIKADIIEFIQNNNDFDWVVCADVLGYIGDLSLIVKSLKNNNLLFSVETSEKCEKYKISESGRYKHNPEYIDNLLYENGFRNIIKEKTILRCENNIPVEGMIFVCHH
ncbi:MAG: tetratricopeptide repeat protein [Alphaproteobacteria bacterium]|nr:tetratricopeptide repeat protein [Alphaproteobacteria bacterium]